MSSQSTVVGLSEVAELFGVTKQVIANWRTRHSDFPHPVAELKSGPVWQREHVIAWAQEHEITVKAVASEANQAVPSGQGVAVTVALVNMKGGVGKSTLTYNLGAYCTYAREKRVLLVDLDPQFNLSQYALGAERYEKHLRDQNLTVFHVFEQFTPKSVSGLKDGVSPEDVIVGIAPFYGSDRRLDLLPSQLELAWTLKNPMEKEQLLDMFLDKVRGSYDLVLIDCPPTESMLTSAAYLASDYVLVPVKLEFLSTIGLPLLVRSMDEFQKRHKSERIELLGIVFNDTGTKNEHYRSREYVEKVAADQKWPIFDNEVTHSDSYPAGSRVGKPIFRTGYARGSKIRDFRAVAEEFITRLGL